MGLQVTCWRIYFWWPLWLQAFGSSVLHDPFCSIKNYLGKSLSDLKQHGRSVRKQQFKSKDCLAVFVELILLDTTLLEYAIDFFFFWVLADMNWYSGFTFQTFQVCRTVCLHIQGFIFLNKRCSLSWAHGIWHKHSGYSAGKWAEVPDGKCSNEGISLLIWSFASDLVFQVDKCLRRYFSAVWKSS